MEIVDDDGIENLDTGWDRHNSRVWFVPTWPFAYPNDPRLVLFHARHDPQFDENVVDRSEDSYYVGCLF